MRAPTAGCQDRMEEDPPSPATSPPPHSAPNRVPHESSNNAGSQYGHLSTFYQLQNMLTRQLNLQPNIPIQQANNTNANDVVIDMPHQNSPHNNDNPQNNGTSANAGDTITTHGIDGTRLDLQLLTTWLEQAFPFVLLLILIWIYEHRNGMSWLNQTHTSVSCLLQSVGVFSSYYV